MVKTGFRPSDDPNDCAYNIPGNAMLSTYLNLVASNILDKIEEKSVFKSEANILSNRMKLTSESIRLSIYKYGVVDFNGKTIFAYEVNGKGEAKTFDDANLPSLLSLSYLQFVDSKDEIYRNTRIHILSHENPYFFKEGKISGIGSSHTPVGSIWPLALMTQVLTTQDEN